MNYRHRITDKVITQAQYAKVRSWDQNDWEPIHEHTIVDTIVDVGVGMVLGDMLFGGNSTPDISSSDSFDGFGGGEFGGGGSGDSW